MVTLMSSEIVRLLFKKSLILSGALFHSHTRAHTHKYTHTLYLRLFLSRSLSLFLSCLSLYLSLSHTQPYTADKGEGKAYKQPAKIDFFQKEIQ